MDETRVRRDAAQHLQAREFLVSGLVHAFARMYEPGPMDGSLAMGPAHQILTVDTQRVRPAVVGKHAQWKVGRAQRRIQRVMMCNGGDAGEQILERSMPQPRLARNL